MKTVTIMQPAYLPWLGFFARIAASDCFIVLDHVQMDMSSRTKFTNRNRIRTHQGWCWLTVPLQTKGKHDTLFINELMIDSTQKWANKHWQAIRHNYARAPFFKEHDEFFEDFYSKDWQRLVDLNDEVTKYLLRSFDIHTEILYSSDLAPKETGSELILELCNRVEADRYLSGPFGRDYLQLDHFTKHGIEVLFHEYTYPTYPQVFDGFEPYMSAVDFLFNCGTESNALISSGSRFCE